MIAATEDWFWPYLAGFIDGEGCFGIYQSGPRLQVTSTNPDVLFWLWEGVGRLGTVHPERKGNPNAKEAVRWNVYLGGLRVIIPQVQPYLRIKKEQAEVILTWMEGITDGGVRLTSGQVEQRELLQRRIRELNRRGLQNLVP